MFKSSSKRFGRLHTKSAAMLGLVAALMLMFSSTSEAFAGVNVTNGEFGSTASGCNLSGWSYIGDVRALTAGAAGLTPSTLMSSSECVARLYSSGRSPRASLQQTFEVPIDRGCFAADLYLRSANTNSAYRSQHLTLSGPDGQIVYEGFNLNGTNADFIKIRYDLSSNVGQSLTLRLWTSVNPADAHSLSWTSLHLDNVQLRAKLIAPAAAIGYRGNPCMDF